MAAINIKVKSDFTQASKDLKSFGTVTAAETKRVETYLKSFKAEKIDDFIDKNRKLGAAYQANKGDISSIITQQKALEKQSISLIAKGLDPEDAAIEKLNTEYNRLQKEYDETVQASKGMETATKAAQKALLGIGVATVAGAATFIKLASSVEMVEASFTPLLGSTEKAEELVAKLNATAATTPFQFENIAAASKQLLPVMNQDIEKTVETFRMLGDTAGGSATKLETITKGYTKAMLKNKVDMESLNMIAEAGVPIYTELAKSLNVSVEEMTKMSSAGKITSQDLTTAFEQMTESGGLFYNGMEIASATAEGKLSTVKDIFKLIGATIGADLLPAWKGFLDTLIETGTGILKFAQDGESLNKTLTIVGLSLAGVTAGLATFLLLSKGAAVIQTLSTAFVALNLAMKANPAIFIASAITAILIPAIILLVKNWDKVAVVLETSLAVLGQAFKLLGVNIKTSWTVAINALKLAWLSLGSIIVDKVLGGVQMFLDLAGKIPFVGDKFKDLSNTVGDTKDAFNALSEDAANNTLAVIQGAENERIAVKKTTDENIENIKLESKERLDALKVQEEANAETTQAVIDSGEKEIAVAEVTGAKITDIGEYYSIQSSAIAEAANDDKEKDSAEMVENITKNIESAISEIETLMTSTTLTFSDLGNAITLIGDAIGSSIISTSGKAVSASSNIIEEIIANAEALQQTLIDTSNDTYSQILENRKALIDETYDLEAERISDTYDLELETIKNTLSEAEILQLQSLGVIAETKAEANETARREALEAAADAGIVAEAQIQAINDVYDAKKTAIEDSETAEATAAAATAQYAYDNALFQRDLSVAQATINKDTALSELPWYTLPSDRKEVESNYDSLISSIASAPLPTNPSAQTGTPMGGFQVPENTGNSRADNTSINVSPGENVSVTPRGEGGNSQNIIVQIDRQVIFDIVNDGNESGDIRISADNIQSA